MFFAVRSFHCISFTPFSSSILRLASRRRSQDPPRSARYPTQQSGVFRKFILSRFTEEELSYMGAECFYNEYIFQSIQNIIIFIIIIFIIIFFNQRSALGLQDQKASIHFHLHILWHCFHNRILKIL